MTEQNKHQADFKLLSSLEEMVLLVIGDATMYGWNILKTLNEACQGARKFSYGSLYPTLHKLEEMGLLTSEWEKEQDISPNGTRKRYYTVTEEGKQALNKMEKCRRNASRIKLTPQHS